MKLTKKQLEEALRLACDRLKTLSECVKCPAMHKSDKIYPCQEIGCGNLWIAYFKEQAVKVKK